METITFMVWMKFIQTIKVIAAAGL